MVVNGNEAEPSGEHEASQCPGRYRCSGGDHNLTMDPGDGTLMEPCETENFNCMCDWLCGTYDDCCDGFSPPVPPHPVKPRSLHEGVFTCDGLGIPFGEDASDGTMFRGSSVHCSYVNRCPKDRPLDSVIKDRCESASSSSFDIDLRLPVNGKASRILYRNLYCAICNGEEDVVYWSVQKFISYAEYIALGRNISNETRELEVDFSDHIRFIYPEGYMPRACRRVIRSCHDAWNGSSTTVENCQLRGKSNAFVTSKVCEDCDYSAYRNRDCALCNWVAEVKEGCSGHDCRRSRPSELLSSFSLLVDYNSDRFAAEDCSKRHSHGAQPPKYSFSHHRRLIKAQCIGDSCAFGYVKTNKPTGCTSSSGATEGTTASGKLLILIEVNCGIQLTRRLLSWKGWNSFV